MAEEIPFLRQLEATIEAGLRTFVEVGHALAKIRDLRLYRTTHTTFETYCKDRWAMSRPRAYQLMASAEVATSVSTTVDISRLPERAIRPLAKLEPEKRTAVLVKAKALAGDKPVTTKHVLAVVGKPKALVLGPPRNGMDFARMALMDLEQIQEVDAERTAALASVKEWLDQRLDRGATCGGECHQHLDALVDAAKLLLLSAGTGDDAVKAAAGVLSGVLDGISKGRALNPRDTVLRAARVALLAYQNDPLAGRKGKPGPADRKHLAAEVAFLVRDFKKGALC